MRAKIIADRNQTALQSRAVLGWTSLVERWKTPRSSARKTRTTPTNDAHCQKVMGAVAGMALGARANPGCLFHGNLSAATGLGTFAFVPPQNERAGDVNTGIGSGDDADQEGESEIVD